MLSAKSTTVQTKIINHGRLYMWLKYIKYQTRQNISAVSLKDLKDLIQTAVRMKNRPVKDAAGMDK